ncbi:nucleotide exchange factor GrpE [Ciceribacter sp. L1K23]|uniref:nucleotide exchange factor GrpE n=1 Tax=unclassified Ciceribacter TaxID=2628820 RepID=UPI001ABE30CB|nr:MULTISPECIES: nucleotide exchange factor GrpE [unclassified Ciceribacter]MBO3758784.1 nucleotide exchange factor GrpE [Ciceribacter sp. L1K22]MBR0557266.1 nucleotide exchange factor GrpE [Ciceribacter sp. L1K23]
MTDHETKNGPDATAVDQSEAAEIQEPIAETTEPDPIEALQAENAELRDRYLRLAAEMDNLRRRTERDVKDAKAYAVTGFARDMLAVSDNLRRALDAIPSEAREAADAGLMALIDGVEMTERAMLSTLERHGVKKIEAEGQKFDPNFHQAMFEVPNPNVPNNTVVQVVQAGYVIGERVLRPAMVGVAKGGAKPEGNGSEQPAEAKQ